GTVMPPLYATRGGGAPCARSTARDRGTGRGEGVRWSGRPAVRSSLKDLAALLGAILRGAGFGEALSLAGVLPLAGIGRALARAVALAGVGAATFHAIGECGRGHEGGGREDRCGGRHHGALGQNEPPGLQALRSHGVHSDGPDRSLRCVSRIFYPAPR